MKFQIDILTIELLRGGGFYHPNILYNLKKQKHKTTENRRKQQKIAENRIETP